MTNEDLIYYLIGFFLNSSKFKETDIYEPELYIFCNNDSEYNLNIERIAYYEAKCLKLMGYNFLVFSTYDWLNTFMGIGYIFEGEIDKNNSEEINDMNTYAFKLLVNITPKNIFFKYSPLYNAVSIIQICREDKLDKSKMNNALFDKLLDLYDISFKDYENCYNEIKYSLENDNSERYSSYSHNSNQDTIRKNRTLGEMHYDKKDFENIKKINNFGNRIIKFNTKRKLNLKQNFRDSFQLKLFNSNFNNKQEKIYFGTNANSKNKNKIKRQKTLQIVECMFSNLPKIGEENSTNKRLKTDQGKNPHMQKRYLTIKNDIMKNKNIRNKSLLPSVFISDFRYYLSQKMNVKIKKEKAQKLKENEIEKIEYINDKINTIEKNYSLFNNTFVNKSNKYLRGINIIKEYEKNKDELLIEKLIDLKNKVNFLNAKVKKIELNNNSFKQWIYLQICLKEKIIKLPESYKIILESKNDNKNILIEKFGEDLVNHVIKYKNSLLYKNAKEFLDQFTLYENKNFELLNKYFEIKEEIRALEIEKKQAKENNVIEKKEKRLNESVIRQTKELNRLKNENIYLEKFKKKLIVSKTQTKTKETNLIEVYKNIYSQTVNIIKNINLLNYDSSINIQTDIYYQNLSEQQKILHNLAKIERIIDILVKNSKLYKQLYSEKMKAIKNLIEKEKKFVNNSEKILKMKLKMEEERQRLLKKNNKIIILPKHKLVIDYKINKKSQNSNELSKKRNKSVENINAYFSEY